MERRTFIKSAGAAGMLLGTGLYSNYSQAMYSPFFQAAIDNETVTITILHTNDTHSHIDPITSGRNAGKGGVARRAAVINKVRQENANTLLLDCGDIFQGTPYFNFYGGELEMKLMALLGYDAATMGNHDFDNGIDGFLKQLIHTNFDFICSNYDFKNTLLEGKTKPYKVFEKEGVKVGVFGVGIELKGLVDKKLFKETEYNDPVTVTQDMVKQLREIENCDLIICMSHLGFSYKSDKIDDLKLANLTHGIDLIIGGHTHTFLDAPVSTLNLVGEKVLVNQVGCYGINLGRIDFHFLRGKRNNNQHIIYNIS